MEQRKCIIRQLMGRQVHVIVDRPIGHVHKGMVYPVNYGYIPSILAGDGEEQDAYILGISEPLTEFDGRVIGAVLRADDCEDKLVVAPEGMVFHQGQIAEAVHFQEQYFDTKVESLYRKSCGVLPFRRTDTGLELLIAWETFSKAWSLPKGHMEAFESEEQTALRKLYEETGLKAVLLSIPPVTEEYYPRPGITKRVTYFAGEVSGEPRPLPGEIDGFRWICPQEADAYLRPGTAEICRKLLKYL